MAALISYGTYIPPHRLRRAEIGLALGSGGGDGTRSVAGYDEDPTSMAVEAARRALGSLPTEIRLQRLLFATASPPYLDKTNANVMHAALGLDSSVLAVDMVGSVRSGVGALVLGSEAKCPTLVAVSDVRTGWPGGADERDGGDGAAALVFGDSGDAIADVLAEATVTEEFLDRWRLPGAPASRVWEERFGEHVYLTLAQAAFEQVLEKAGITTSEVDVLVGAGTHARSVRSFVVRTGVGRVGDDLSSEIGNTGTAQPGILLAHVLDHAAPRQTIALVVLADGATAVLLRTTNAIVDRRPAPSVADQLLDYDLLRYADFLAWRGFLIKEPPRRPEPVGPAAPPTRRAAGYKYGFVAHRCENCGTVHLPAVRVCVNCKAIDRMSDLPMADRQGTIVTFTVDHLAFSASPPVIAAVIDFDGGGRLSCEITDADPHGIAVGDRVEMSFRKVSTASGVHNYFWKARPSMARRAEV